MNVKLRVLSVGALFFIGNAVSAQKVKKDTAAKETQIEEVVMVGYGKQKKSDVSGSITTVKSDVLQDKPVASVELALQGKAPGVQVANTGGRSGNETKISIRGNGSLSASNNPLYIIDGVPQESLGNLSPEDISSMEILKDAASAAIYGSRASNGVVLVETKGGRYNGKPAVSFSTSYGIQEIIKRPRLLNAQQYKQVHDVARQNYLNDIAAGTAAPPANMATLTPMPNTGIDTDWMDFVLRTGSVTNNQVSFTAGGESSKMYFSAGHIGQEGIIRGDDFEISRVRLNVEQKFADNFKIGVNSYFTYSSAKPVADDNDTYQPYSNAMAAPPNLAPYAANGKINRFNYNNPLWGFERQVTDKWQTVGANFFAIYNPIKEITLKTSLSGNIASRRYNRFDAPNTRRGEREGQPWGYGAYLTANNRDYLIENTAAYDKGFFDNRLKVNVMVGQSFQRWDYEDSSVYGENFVSNDLPWLSAAGIVNKGDSNIYSMALYSFFGRAQVSWENKYHLMVSTRYDGSSKFRDGYRWGSFPAASLGWTVSNEEFFKVPFINEFKLRASYGLTGNQTGIPYSAGMQLISSGENQNQEPGMAVLSLNSETLKWEKGKSFDAGLDLSMFNKRVNLTVDYYNKTTSDLLYRLPIGQESGFSNRLSNIGTINNKGIEISVDTKIIRGEKFKWDFGANFSYNKNVVEKIGTKSGQFTTGFVSIVKEGEALGSFYLYDAVGIAQERYEYKDQAGNVTKVVQAGDMIYRDVNGDGKIDTNDRVVFNGGIAPMYGGISTTFTYDKLDLSINAQYSIGKKIYAMYKQKQEAGAPTGYPSYSPNMVADQMNYWTPDNRDTNVPRPHMASAVAAWNNEQSTRFLENADYLRITDITIGYNFDKTNLKFIKSMRLYAQVRNPFTFTKYSGVDPEAYYYDRSLKVNQSFADTSKISSGVDTNGIPNVKVYSIGMNINF
ncbi:SusC/RagA family TonB-linked outer membrane protein [Chryseobacterium sp. MYb328]|uniref:SusC/RagA family TonB-linked outer membrane protein n=1 Tax=Chryseobacterium sp. MYb328 TaxID=2745231 RepID=UPI0030B46DC4